MTPATRYPGTASIDLTDGWRLERITEPSRLFGANGIRTGPDGRVYVAQVAGSQISALDLGSGTLETISAKGSDIVAPDDVAFDDAGDMYVTEYYDGRVSVRESNGATRLLRDDLPGANGITIHQGRLFVNECRPGGRLMELDRSGGAPKILAEDLPMPNGMEVGPDGKLYYPLLGANEIWRIDLDGGQPERVAADLGGPDAVKFDAEGYIVSTQVASGQVLRIDPRSGEQTLLAQLSPGLDNLTFADGRLLVSSFTGQITEILAGGGTQTVLADGLTWPLDLTVGSDGTLVIADGTFLLAHRGGAELQTLGMLFSPGYPGYIRGIAASGDGEFVVAGNGSVSRYSPAAAETEVLVDGLDQLYGVAVSADGLIAVADLGTGTVHAVRPGQAEVMASGLDRPIGVAFTADGTCLVSESGAGRVAAVTSSGTDTIVDGLETPHGIVVDGSQLYIVDTGTKSVVNVDLETKSRQVIATNLPVGAPPGVTPKPLLGLVPFSGPQGPFAGIAAGPDGTLYVSADADGSVIALRKEV
ncbi:SMP-30/gluconolactonase/LRE family protein [Gordonia sp. LSe1-13]|uniref:SMP-30/gluconolactonase/LRE family protein n=1 Tax=Gordonia sesuvii TaxID=3116777 RepID=A0ABU7M7F3_9ACTN|nr:SMP-30/gluconolactonase/LRE family protein [Gordonia sp. LSe1-13]